MVTKAERELKNLADHNAPGLGAAPARRTGAERGSVKQNIQSSNPVGKKVTENLNGECAY